MIKTNVDRYWMCHCGGYLKEDKDKVCKKCGARVIWNRKHYTEDTLARILLEEPNVQIRR